MLSFSVSFFITIVNFYILYWVIRKWLWKPVRTMLEKRSETVKSDLANAAQAKGKAEALQNRYETMISGAEAEANKIRLSASEQAAADAKIVVGGARHEAEAIRARAEEAALKEKAAALESLAGEIARIATEAAARLASRESSAVDAAAAVALVHELGGRDGR